MHDESLYIQLKTTPQLEVNVLIPIIESRKLSCACLLEIPKFLGYHIIWMIDWVTPTIVGWLIVGHI